MSTASAQPAEPVVQDVCELRPDFCSDSTAARRKAKKLIRERKAAKKCRNAADSYSLDDTLPVCGRETARRKKKSEKDSLEEFLQTEETASKAKRHPASVDVELDLGEEAASSPQPAKVRSSITFSDYIKDNSNHPALSRNLRIEQKAFNYPSRTALPSREAAASSDTKAAAPVSDLDKATSVREGDGAVTPNDESNP